MKNVLMFIIITIIFPKIGFCQLEPKYSLKNVDSPDPFFADDVHGVVFSQHEDEIYVLNSDAVQRWNFKNEEIIQELTGISDAWDFNSDFSKIVVGGGRGKSIVLNTQNGSVEYVLEGHNETFGSGRNENLTLILHLAISNNDQYLVTVANDSKKVILWNFESKELLHIFSNFGSGPITFTPDNDLFSINHIFFNIKTFEKEIELDQDFSTTYTLFSHSGNYFFSNAKGKLNIWDWNSKKIISDNDYDGDRQGFFSMDISPNDRYLLGGSSDGNIYIIDLESDNFISFKTNESTTQFIYHPVNFHPSGKYFAVGVDKNVLIYDLQEVLANQSIVNDWVTYE